MWSFSNCCFCISKRWSIRVRRGRLEFRMRIGNQCSAFTSIISWYNVFGKVQFLGSPHFDNAAACFCVYIPFLEPLLYWKPMTNCDIKEFSDCKNTKKNENTSKRKKSLIFFLWQIIHNCGNAVVPDDGKSSADIFLSFSNVMHFFVIFTLYQMNGKWQSAWLLFRLVQHISVTLRSATANLLRLGRKNKHTCFVGSARISVGDTAF